MTDLLVIRGQLCPVLLRSAEPDGRLQTRIVATRTGFVRPLIQFGLEPLDLRREARGLVSQLSRIGFAECRVERRQDIALPDDVANPGIEAAHYRRLERLHDDR